MNLQWILYSLLVRYPILVWYTSTSKLSQALEVVKYNNFANFSTIKNLEMGFLLIVEII